MGNEKAVTAFICGGKGDHEHNDDGEVLFWDTGEVTEDTPENRKEMAAKGSRNTGGSVCCSICGSSAFDRHAMTGFDDGFDG